MGADRDVSGRFVKGHVPIPGAHRPIGAPNLVTRSLRERVLAGFGAEDGVTNFVKDLKENYPPAAAGLLARMIPPADEPADGANGMITTVNILSIPVGTFLVGNPLRVATEEEARQFSGAEARLLIEHQPATKEMIASPVQSLEPEPSPQPEEMPIEPEEPDDGGVFLVRSAGFQRRRIRPPD